MAIDYKKEWEKLEERYGAFGVNIPHEALSVRLKALMDAQIRDTINDREKLMREYLMEKMRTDINGGDKVCYHVRIVFRGDTYTNVKMVKADFDAWCKKKGGK